MAAFSSIKLYNTKKRRKGITINVLIKPSLGNTYNNSCNYYNYSTKQHVSALFGHHQAYKTVVLVKVHSVACTYGIPWFTIVLSIFFELQVLFKLMVPELFFFNFSTPCI